jgi:hypothetical protein
MKYFFFLSSFVPPCLRVIKFGLIAVLFLFLPVFLYAQNGETRFIQWLIWAEDEYALLYEVVIEKEEEGEYRGLFQEFTEGLSMQVHLLPGKYRCRVITHDFLNRPGPVPEWRYIEVLAARNPGQAHLEQVHLEIAQTSDDADTQVNFFLSAAWTPSFTVSDGESRFFERDMSLCGATVRFGVVWAGNFFNINPGLELPVSYNFFNTGSGEPAHLLTLALNLTALKRLPDGNLDLRGSRRRVPGNRTALTFRLGAGYGLLFANDASIEASFSGGKSFHINAGVSFLLFIMENWYLETGLDYAHWFTSPASYYFKPWVGVGFSK